jgi:hypothetical protein
MAIVAAQRFNYCTDWIGASLDPAVPLGPGVTFCSLLTATMRRWQFLEQPDSVEIVQCYDPLHKVSVLIVDRYNATIFYQPRGVVTGRA